MGFLFSKEESLPNTFLIVAGLTSSGKTHFLDMFTYGSDTTKRPTIGFYETRYESFIMREIGGSMDWKSMIEPLKPQIDGLIFIVDANATDESIMESRNLLLGICNLIPPNKKVVLLLNRKIPEISIQFKKITQDLLQLNHLSAFRKVIVCDLNFEVAEWQEKISKVFERI
jgi:ADP-ribosylation factor family